MPLERYDIAPHTIMPKHLLRERTGTMLVNMDSSVPTTAPNETWTVDVCADEPHALSGLASVDGVTISQLSAVLYAGDGNIYQPQSGAWLQHAVQPSVGDVVLVKHGTKHAGTSHQVTLDSNGSRLTVHHSTAIATGLGNVTVNTVSTVLQHTAIEINDPQLTTINPLAYTVKSGREGVYAIHATVYYTPVGASPTVWLSLYRNGVEIVQLDIGQFVVGTYVHLQGSTMIACGAGDSLDLRLTSSVMHAVGSANQPTYARTCITRIR
ncbi:MAG: hypothetical protein KatS3mg038_2931 [Candidatus Kapaibacterium sp.]|nr:MAG: hypothetical protein KatS3mg038_1189 [Candidatus Kapabacteria bacterium]GIV52410.1 MAG: hypothetical protein KatS3mg038_2931 [Candidatus Kapabacteria bacterium]